ncbi:Fc receptor-like B [Mantella aurantiaca]
MSALIAVLFLWLNIGKSGGAIRPVVTFTPNWWNVLQSDSVTMRCDEPSTEPDEPRTYSWYKDMRPILGDQQTRQFIASLGDSGDYQCQINAGNVSDPVNLHVALDAVILQIPASAIYEGDPLTLRCSHLKTAIGKNIRFYKDGVEINSQFPDSELRIHKVDLNTAGHYKCIKRLSLTGVPGSQDFSAAFSVSVKELFPPPEIKVTPYRVREGGDMTVTCDVRLDPPRSGTELQFAFYRDGRTMREFNGSDTYRVQPDQLEDPGNYTCEARTASGTVMKKSDGFRIKIHGEDENLNECLLDQSHIIVIFAFHFFIP